MPHPDPPSHDIDLLKGLRLFRRLAPAELADVARLGRRRKLRPGAVLFAEAAPADTFYVLAAGRMKLVQLTPEGHQVLLRIVDAGEMLGVIAALAESTYPASAEAVGECTVLAWDGKTMGRLLDRYPRIALDALGLVAARLHELQDRYRELATQRVEQRVARALLRLARQAGLAEVSGTLIDLPLTRQDVAEMTGTTLFTVSRLLRGWARRGLIKAGRRRLVVRDAVALTAVADDVPAARIPPSLRPRNDGILLPG